MGAGGLSILFSRQQIRIRTHLLGIEYRGERLNARESNIFLMQSKLESEVSKTEIRYEDVQSV